MLDRIRAKVEAGERLTPEEGTYLLQDAPLLDLAPLAQTARFRHNSDPVVTFVVDTNLNYTNVCDAYCTFCAFYRTEKDSDAYTYSVEEMMGYLGAAASKGVTTVLLQGGLNPNLPMEYYVELVQEARHRYPEVHPHFFSAPEIMKMVQVSELSLREVLTRLYDAGLRTIPGGGSEVLSNSVKHKISRLFPKGKVDDWTSVHLEAHRLGYRTTATMMYGHLEEDEDIIEHLGHVRSVQDETGGFTAFIPWSYKAENTALARKVKSLAGPNRYLRIMALSRLYLGQRPAHPGLLVLRGKEDGPGSPTFRRGRFRRHPVRRERDAGSGVLQPHQRRRSHRHHQGRRLHPRPAHHPLRGPPPL